MNTRDTQSTSTAARTDIHPSSSSPGHPDDLNIGAITMNGAHAGPANANANCSLADTSSPEVLKNCACCHRILPGSDYSGAQRKVKGRRQCKICVAGITAISQRKQCSEGEVKLESPENLQRNVTTLMSYSIECTLTKGILLDLIAQMRRKPLSIHIGSIGMSTQLVVGLLQVAHKAQTDQLRLLVIECIAVMCGKSVLLAQFLAAGIIPILIELLQSCDQNSSTKIDTVVFGSVFIVAAIARASHRNCNDLLAAGVLPVLLPFVRCGISADLRDQLLSVLTSLVSERQPVGDISLLVTHLSTVIIDNTAPSEILLVCFNVLNAALVSVAKDYSSLESWIESILSTTPKFPQRLVQLLDGTQITEVAHVTLSHVSLLFCTDMDKLRQLFECGLTEKLLHLLNESGAEQLHLVIAFVCANAAAISKVFASMLFENAAIIQQILTLMSTATRDILRTMNDFVAAVLAHRDRHMTGRLVNEFHVLPTIVTILRRAIDTSDHRLMLQCLHSLEEMLIVGETEAVDDSREVNPYIEPIDWLGVFELVSPLQKNADGQLSELANRIFGYFIPNDCE